MHRPSVDFPDPLCPMIPSTSPVRTVKLTFSSTVRVRWENHRFRLARTDAHKLSTARRDVPFIGQDEEMVRSSGLVMHAAAMS